NIVEATRHLRAVNSDIRRLKGMTYAELVHEAKLFGGSVELLAEVQRLGRLPVVTFVAGGVAAPAHAPGVMQLGADGVFLGARIFKSEGPPKRAHAIAAATPHC